MTDKPTLKPEPRQFFIGTLAEAAGVTRRVVRFYVQRGLLPPPLGRGRGSHYNETHLNRLLDIQQRQAKGESLDAIQTAVGQQAENVNKTGEEKLAVSEWQRLELAPGVELNINTAQYPASAHAITQIQHRLANLSDYI